MSQGRIEQVGSADDIYDRPQSPFVFSFIGQSNALPVEVRGGEIAFAGQVLGRTDEADGHWRMFMRPHDLEIVPAGEPGIAGRVAVARRSGSSRFAEFDVPGRSERIEVELPASVASAPGMDLNVRPKRWTLYAEESR